MASVLWRVWWKQFGPAGLGTTIPGKGAALLWGPLGTELGWTHMSSVVCKALLMLMSASCWIQHLFVVGRAFCWSVGFVDCLQKFVSGLQDWLPLSIPWKLRYIISWYRGVDCSQTSVSFGGFCPCCREQYYKQSNLFPGSANWC